MSDVAQGPGWWLASDGKWYPPESAPAPPPPQTPYAGPYPAYGSASAPGPGYGPTSYPGYPPASPPTSGTNGMAIASMVLGILWLYWIGSILALIFGYIALNQIKVRRENGRGMAIAGVVLGWIGVGTGILVIVIAIIASARSS
jgi:hypothetical protein